MVTERERVDALKESSLRVQQARKKTGKQEAKSTQDIIDGMIKTYPGASLLTKPTVNRHVQQGKAGQSPTKRGQPRVLPLEGEAALIVHAQEADEDLVPLSMGQFHVAYIELVEGTTFALKFKNGKPSKGALNRLLERNSEFLQTEFPQNMEPLRAKNTFYENISEWFDVSRDVYLEIGAAEKNPVFADSSKDKQAGEVLSLGGGLTRKVDEIIITRACNISSCDEMPAFFNANTGQKAKQDKRITKVRHAETAKAKTGDGSRQRRGKSRCARTASKNTAV